ncbi:hypothetical protein CWC16_19685, partial [Pseudoalteromonas sp. S3776]
MFLVINSGIRRFEREKNALSTPLEKRLAVIIVFHYLHEKGNPAYKLSSLNRAVILSERQHDSSGRDWQLKHGYYLDLEKTSIPDRAYENPILLILRAFSPALFT